MMRSCVLFSILYLTANLPCALAVTQEKIAIGVSEYPPLFVRAQLFGGGMGRILKEAFASEGYAVEFHWVPWNRAYTEVRNGVYDATPCWSKNAEREKEVLFSNSLYQTYHVFYHLKSTPLHWENLGDLKGKIIGVTRGYNYGEEFDLAVKAKKISIELADSDELNFRKLVAGRIQIFVVNKITGAFIARSVLTKTQLQSIAYDVKRATPPADSFVLFSNSERGKKLKAAFDVGLEKLKSSGLYRKYLDDAENGKYAQ